MLGLLSSEHSAHKDSVCAGQTCLFHSANHGKEDNQVLHYDPFPLKQIPLLLHAQSNNEEKRK